MLTRERALCLQSVNECEYVYNMCSISQGHQFDLFLVFTYSNVKK